MRDEFAKIEWLKKRFEIEGESKTAIVGIGDDAAVLDFGRRPTIVTVDTQVEGVHFRHDLISPRDLGYRAILAAVSDVWAMAATPSASVIALTLPSGFSDEDFRELIEGLAEAARVSGAKVVGGNLSGGESLTITTTAFGLPLADSLTRAGARPGDRIYVSGTVGSAALGLAVLEADSSQLEHAAAFIARWKRPPRNGHLVRALAESATAVVDVSDGCLQDLEHLCAASGVGATLHADALPTATGYEETCKALGLNPRELSLTGGEDYELLFTAAESSLAASVGTPIGRIVAGAGVRVVDEAGEALEIGRGGFRHFS